MDKAASPKMYAFAAELAELALKNVELLRRDTPKNEAQAVLYDWAVVLTVLEVDVFEAAVELISQSRFRATNILIRSLIEFATRLRYYVIQSLKPLKALENEPDKISYIRKEIHAVSDWENADYALGKKLTRYDPQFWVAQYAENLKKIADDPKSHLKRGFQEMNTWLEQNEEDIRRILPLFSGQLGMKYRNLGGEWANQSTFVHGDQAVISDVFEFDENKKTGKIYPKPELDLSRTLIFSAVMHLLHVNESIEILRGWSFGTHGSFGKAARLWDESGSY